MMYWDYCVRADTEAEESAATARKLGWKGICILSEGAAKKRGDDMEDATEGLLIKGKNPEDVKKRARSRRKDFGIIAVIGTTEDANRAAAETKEVDILIPGVGTKVDVTMARIAKEKDVRIAFDFSALIHSTLEDRGRIFSQMKKNADSVRKMRARFILTSGALSAFGLRAPSELASFGRLLGFKEPDIKESMSGALIEENMKRLSGRWIMPGVEVEK